MLAKFACLFTTSPYLEGELRLIVPYKIRLLRLLFGLLIFSFFFFIFCAPVSFPAASFAPNIFSFLSDSKKTHSWCTSFRFLAAATTESSFSPSSVNSPFDCTPKAFTNGAGIPNSTVHYFSPNCSIFLPSQISSIMGNISSVVGSFPSPKSSFSDLFFGKFSRINDEVDTKNETLFHQERIKDSIYIQSATEERGKLEESPSLPLPGTAEGHVPDNFSGDPEELIIQTWAFCKAKPSPNWMYTSEAEIAKRKEAVQFRERPSFTQLDCGEDSFFVANHHKAIGVADGVGGWRKKGVDPSAFSNALMANAKAYTDTHENDLNPQKIMDTAHKKILLEKKVKAGSSTACIAALQKKKNGSYELDVANLGDSGLLVVRDRKYVFRAREQQHSFNAPYQLAAVSAGSRSFSDMAKDAAREHVPVEEGDVIVMGTDGLFDNRFAEHLAEDAGWIGWLPSNYSGSSPSTDGAKNVGAATFHNSNAFLRNIPVIGTLISWSGIGDEPIGFTDPFRVAQRLVMDASKASLNQSSITPWSMELRKRGSDRAKGGKTDDITVVLGRIAKRGANNSNIPTW